MNISIVPEPRPNLLALEKSASVAATSVRAILNNRDAPVPAAITLGTRTVSIVDMVKAISTFRLQNALLTEVGSKWPAVLLRERGRDGKVNGTYWAPLDMSDIDRGPTDKFALDKRNYSSGFIQSATAESAKENGFETAAQEPEMMKETFSKVIGKILSRRGSAANDVSSAPPTAAFTVVTNTPNVEILYATGYFVSTQQGFGFSTPALKSLPWGNYIFGTKIKSDTTFSDTIWVVPMDNFTKLEV